MGWLSFLKHLGVSEMFWKAIHLVIKMMSIEIWAVGLKLSVGARSYLRLTLCVGNGMAFEQGASGVKRSDRIDDERSCAIFPALRPCFLHVFRMKAQHSLHGTRRYAFSHINRQMVFRNFCPFSDQNVGNSALSVKTCSSLALLHP